MLLFECLGEFLVASLKLCPSIVEGKLLPLSLEKGPLSPAIGVWGLIKCLPHWSSRLPLPLVLPPTRAPSAECSFDAASGQLERVLVVH